MCTGTHTCATGTVCTHYSSAATALNSGNLATLRSSVSFVTGSIISLQHEKTSAIKKQNGIRTWNTLTEKKHEAAQSKLLTCAQLLPWHFQWIHWSLVSLPTHLRPLTTDMTVCHPRKSLCISRYHPAKRNLIC